MNQTAKQPVRRVLTVGCVLALGLAGTACGGDDDDAGGDTIDVVLSERSVEAPATAKAGAVTINASNEGGETHELVVVRAPSSAGSVQDETGKVDEDGFAEGDFIGEIVEFEAGTGRGRSEFVTAASVEAGMKRRSPRLIPRRSDRFRRRCGIGPRGCPVG